jgi:hypothetical protein
VAAKRSAKVWMLIFITSAPAPPAGQTANAGSARPQQTAKVAVTAALAAENTPRVWLDDFECDRV